MALSPHRREWLGRLATGAAFLFGLYFLYRLIQAIGLAEIEVSLAKIDGQELTFLLLLPILTLLFMTVRLALILKILGHPIGWAVVAAFSLAGTSLSYLVPGGEITDLATRALLLGRAGLPTRTAVLSVVIDGFIRFAVNAVLLFAVALYLFTAGFGEDSARPTLLIGLAVAGSILFLLGLVIRQGTAQWFIRTASKIGRSPAEEEAIAEAETLFVNFFRRLHPWTYLAFAVTAAGFLWEPLQIMIILKFLDVTLPFWQVFWLYHALLFPRLIPIPAGLGVSEGGGALFSALVGQGSALGLTVSLLSRVRSLPYVLLGLVILPLAGFIKVKQSS